MLSLSVFSGCPDKDYPPSVDPICTLDGRGGADCVHPNGERIQLSPSALKNMWATSQDSFARFAAWCYQVDAKELDQKLNQIKTGQTTLDNVMNDMAEKKAQEAQSADYGSGG